MYVTRCRKTLTFKTLIFYLSELRDLYEVAGQDVQIARGKTVREPAVETQDSEPASKEVKGIWCAGSAQLGRDGSFHFLGIALAV